MQVSFEETLLDLDFVRKKFNTFLNSAECFAPFVWSVKADLPLLESFNVLQQIVHLNLVFSFLLTKL